MKDYKFYCDKKDFYIKKCSLFGLLTLFSVVLFFLFSISFYISFVGFILFFVFMPLWAYNSRKKEEYIKLVDYIDLQRVANNLDTKDFSENK